jgi:hypothetical protein
MKILDGKFHLAKTQLIFSDEKNVLDTEPGRWFIRLLR